MTQETMHFEAEVKQLLHLVVHSLYSNKEIFLRELISNASDAADKLRFEGMKQSELYENDPNLSITIDYDAKARTVTIEDNGIGMSQQEAVANLGTIAKSGTRDFFQKLSGDQKKDANLIGQFGVGFYSGFIVAEKITVESRRAGLPAKEGVRWESAGEGDFTVEPFEKAARGTKIILHLREGEDEFLSGWKLKTIIQKYSDHISLPILMSKEEWDKDTNAFSKKEEKETVNQASALWTRAKNEITDDQYKAFYRHIAHDPMDPVAWTHSRVEGLNEYTQLLYIPNRAPMDLWERDRRTSVKLYIKRVFVMDDAAQLLPNYLRFVAGVIDSSELPLNVSRELLQESRDVKTIREGCTKRILGLLEDLAENQTEKYAQFWKEFGQVLKEGMAEDQQNSERIIKLLRFASTQDGTQSAPISLADYVARMKDGQDKIYYLTAENWLAAINSPHLEIFRKKGIEVLLLTDRVDEWMMSSLTEFEGKTLSSIARGNLDLGSLADSAEKEDQQKISESEDYKALLEKMVTVLSDKAKEIKITFRLTDSPACLIADEGEMSGVLQRLLKAAGQNMPSSKPILEINPTHPFIKNLQKLQQASKNEAFEDWCHVLFDQALLAEGGVLADAASFVKRTNRLLINVDQH